MEQQHAPGQPGSTRRNQAVVGLTLLHEQFPLPQLVELGVQAEQAGFAAVWADDHFEPWQDNLGHCGLAWVTLAALGQRTQRLLLGTGVTCPSYRYRPQLVAQAFASLGLLYPGRVFLGVGAGEAVNEIPGGGGWGDYQERVARMEEAVTLIRRLWTGEWVSHQGRYYSVDQARLYDVPSPPVPIYVAASGPKSMALAGKIGDGLVSFTEQVSQPELRQAFEQGVRAVGKQPASMPIVVAHVVVVGDRQEAERWAPLLRFSSRVVSYLNDPDPRSIQRRAEQDVPLEQVYSTWVICGPTGEFYQPFVHAAKPRVQTWWNNALEALPKGGGIVACLFFSTPFRERFRGTVSKLDNFQPNSDFSSTFSQTLLLFHAISPRLLRKKARIVFYACQPLLLKRDKLCFRSQWHKQSCMR